MPEQRRSPRGSRPLEGRIGYAGKYRLRCIVLNVSRSGAKLALKSSTELPIEFFLSISRGDAQGNYWVRVKWRRSNTLGVAFLEPSTQSDPVYGLSRGRGVYRT